jgi:hypothetical protein
VQLFSVGARINCSNAATNRHAQYRETLQHFMCIYEQQLIFGYNVVDILYKPASCRTFASEMRRKLELTDIFFLKL